jgi:hypothetical protein
MFEAPLEVLAVPAPVFLLVWGIPCLPHRLAEEEEFDKEEEARSEGGRRGEKQEEPDRSSRCVFITAGPIIITFCFCKNN